MAHSFKRKSIAAQCRITLHQVVFEVPGEGESLPQSVFVSGNIILLKEGIYIRSHIALPG